MNEKRYEGSDAKFEEDLREQYGSLLAGRGPCPDQDTLIQYSDCALPPEESAAVEHHVLSCGSCDHLMNALRQMNDEWESPKTTRSRWPSFERRLRKRLHSRLFGQSDAVLSAAPGPRGRPWARFGGLIASVVMRPAFAYALVLILVYPAYLGLSMRQGHITPPPRSSFRGEAGRGTSSVASSDVQPAVVIDLSVTRDGRTPAVRPLPDDESFILSFFVPMKIGFTYYAVIRDSTGKALTTVPLKSPDGTGNFSLVCNRRRFGPGTYSLEVLERDPRTGQVQQAGAPVPFEL